MELNDTPEPEEQENGIYAVLFIFLVALLILAAYHYSPLSKQQAKQAPPPSPCRLLGEGVAAFFDNNENEFYVFALPEAIAEYYRVERYSQVLLNPRVMLGNLFDLMLGGFYNEDPESILRRFDIREPSIVTAIVERAREVMHEGHPEPHLIADLGWYGEVVYCRAELRHTAAPRVAWNVTYYGDPETREWRVEDMSLAW